MLAIIIELGWPIWPLILASVLALALIIERSFALRRDKILPGRLLTDVIALWKKRQMSAARIAELEQNSPLGRVLAAALRNDHATREGAMQQVEAAGASVAITRLYLPEKSKQTQLFEGSAQESAAKLVEKLRFEARVL